MNITKVKNKTFAISAILFFIFITFIRVVSHQPWYDEAHAWTISQLLSFREIISLMSQEGHMFIWYALLMPFAKNNWHYPYPMLFINWAFCLGAVILMWWKAPFSKWLKFFITFSFPFLGCLAIIARCYSIGVLFLFALAALYKNRLKYPIWFCTFIFLAANTSIMALFGAMAFGGILLFDLAKDYVNRKKDFWISLSIAILTAVVIYVQIGHSSNSPFINDSNFSKFFLDVFFPKLWKLSSFTLLSAVSSLVMLVVSSFKDKRALFFIGLTVGALLILFSKLYTGYYHHYIFLYIYMIITFWITVDSENYSFNKLLTILLSALFCLNIFYPFKNVSPYFTSYSNLVAKAILADNNFKNGRLIFVSDLMNVVLPYIDVKDYDIVYLCQINKFSPVESANAFSDCNSAYYQMKYDDLVKYLSPDKNNYLFYVGGVDHSKEIDFSTKNGDIHLIRYNKNIGPYKRVYRIIPLPKS